MTVAKIPDDSMHNVFLSSIGRTVNVVRDCNDNFIVSLMIAEALQAEYSYPFEEIEWCPIITEELF